MKRTIYFLFLSLFTMLICSEIVSAQLQPQSADFSTTFSSGFSVQKRRYWNEKSELATSQWRLSFPSNSGVTTPQVDAVISKIKKVNIEAYVSKDNPPAPASVPVFQIEFTMEQILAFGRSFVNYEKIYSPSYNVNEGRWSYPALESNFSLLHELFLNLPGDTFIVWTKENPPPWLFWDITLTFEDGSKSNFWDRWVGPGPSAAAPLEYSPMYWVDDDIPEGNSKYAYVNLKSLKIFQINDLDAPGKKNLLFMWDPINPLYDINKFPNEGDGFVQTTSAFAAHPGWELRFYCSWKDEKNGVLPASGLELRTSDFLFAQMPAHMNHFVLPWSYLEYAISHSTQDGFQVSFHSRSRNARLREISSFSKTKIFEFDHNYPKWSITPHKKNH